MQTIIDSEISNTIKKDFHYLIPVIQVEKAGITSTGAPCENELIEVVQEFRRYNLEQNLWSVNEPKPIYKIDGDKIHRSWH